MAYRSVVRLDCTTVNRVGGGKMNQFFSFQDVIITLHENKFTYVSRLYLPCLGKIMLTYIGLSIYAFYQPRPVYFSPHTGSFFPHTGGKMNHIVYVSSTYLHS